MWYSSIELSYLKEISAANNGNVFIPVKIIQMYVTLSSICKFIDFNVYEHLFSILSDHAPSIQVLFQNQKQTLGVPRQSIRLFLSPWYDGENYSFVCQVYLFDFVVLFRNSDRSNLDFKVNSCELKGELDASSSSIEKVYHKGDVIQSDSHIRKKFNGKQWRRLCAFVEFYHYKKKDSLINVSLK